MASMVEIVAILGLLVAAGGYFLIKEKKVKQRALAVGVVMAFFGAAFGGLAFAGIPAFLSQAPGGPEPKAGGLWDAAFNSGSDTDRTEATETISLDGHSITYFMTDANMDGLGDIDLEADVFNLNSGLNTEVWGLTVSISAVGTVLVSGIPSPVANYTADRTRFNVAYSLTTAGAPTLVQVGDKAYSYDWATGSSDEVNMDLPIDPAVADDLPAGGSFSVSYSVGGIILRALLYESS